MTRCLAATLAGLALLAARVPAAAAMCWPVGCDGCQLAWSAQFNLVAVDHAAGRIRLVPNIQFGGVSPRFALIVPTPTLPDFALAPPAVWTDALAATSLIDVGGGGRFACDREAVSWSPAGGVTVHDHRILGGMEATTLSAGEPSALTQWFLDNGFQLPPDATTRFTPFVDRAWFFTAMRPDTTDPANALPSTQWSAQVQPIVMSYAASEFELPLDLVGINAAVGVPIVVFAVDDHRMILAGFRTDYANRVVRGEFNAMQRRFPALAAFLGPDRWLTRLERTFSDPAELRGSLVLQRAPRDDEYRRTLRRWGFTGVGPLGLVVVMLMLRKRRYTGSHSIP